MDTLSKLYSRHEIWFVLFFKSNDKEMLELFKTLSDKTYGIFKVGAVNCKTEEEICEEYSVRDTPKILYFPENSDDYETYNGPKIWEKIYKFGAVRMQSFVRIINTDNYDDFISTNPNLYKVILFTAKKSTPPMFKALSKHFLGKLNFGEVRQSETNLVNKFNIKKFPTLLVITDESNYKGVAYTEEFTRDAMQKFLNKYAYKKKENNINLEIKELTPSLYNKMNFCNKYDRKNICLIYFTSNSPINDTENSLLKNITNSFKTDPLKVFYLNPNKYSSFWDSFKQEDQHSGAIIIKGKKKRYIAIPKDSINYDKLSLIIGNVFSGSGIFKNLIKGLNFDNKQDL